MNKAPGPPPLPAKAVLRYNRQAKFCKVHGKPGYKTRRKARRAAESSRNAGTSLAAYECGTCGLWHVTSDVERTKAERSRA